MGLFTPKDPGEWTPAKGDIVRLSERAPDLWDELKELEGRVTVVEHTKPPHTPEPSGRLEVVILHDGRERTLCAPKETFTFVRKG